MAERLIEIQDTNQFQALCGSFDENLKLLEQRYLSNPKLYLLALFF